MNAKQILSGYIESLEKIIIDFNFNEENAVSLLNELKAEMGKKNSVDESEKELFEACVYNALATINTVPNQNKKNRQLLESLTEAKDEMLAISEIM